MSLNPQPSTLNVPGRRRLLLIIVSALTIAFAIPLWQLLRLALKSELQSHILLIPFISLYLWKTAMNSHSPQSQFRSSFLAALAPVSFALVALVLFVRFGLTGRVSHTDALSLSTAAFLGFIAAAVLAILGWPFIRSRCFAFFFLIFMIPLPVELTDFLSVALQHASAEAASWMIAFTGMPTYREGMTFQFAGVAIRVAEECSGLRSTFVLFITSLLAGQIFLRTGWRKAVLAAVIFPLGILRNGFRVTVLSWLTVNVDRTVMDGPIHHQGGPLFFLLSLLPLFALLWLLRRSETRKAARTTGNHCELPACKGSF